MVGVVCVCGVVGGVMWWGDVVCVVCDRGRHFSHHLVVPYSPRGVLLWCCVVVLLCCCVVVLLLCHCVIAGESHIHSSLPSPRPHNRPHLLPPLPHLRPHKRNQLSPNPHRCRLNNTATSHSINRRTTTSRDRLIHTRRPRQHQPRRPGHAEGMGTTTSGDAGRGGQGVCGIYC